MGDFIVSGTLPGSKTDLIPVPGGLTGSYFRASDFNAVLDALLDLRSYLQGIQPGPPIFSVRSFGAAGDGLTDDRHAILKTIVTASLASGSVFFPSGTYMLAREPGSFHSLNMPVSNVTLFGERGKSWLKHPDAAASGTTLCAMIRISNRSNINFRDLGFDGNWGNTVSGTNSQTGINQITQLDPKNYVMFIYGSDGIVQTANSNIRIENCDFRQSYGDCIWIGAWSSGVKVQNCTFNMSARNGITLSNDASNVDIIGCDFDNIFTQGIDTEPVDGPVSDIVIQRCNINGWWAPTGSQAIAITIQGGAVTYQAPWNHAQNYRISDCTINGAVLISDAKNIHLSNNTIRCDFTGTNVAPVAINQFADNIWVTNNSLYARSSGSTLYNYGVVSVALYPLSTYAAAQPANVNIKGNSIKARNTLDGIFVQTVGGGPGYSGIATAISNQILVSTGAGWNVNQYQGHQITIAGKLATVFSGSSEALYLAPVRGVGSAWYDSSGAQVSAPTTGSFIILPTGGVTEIADNMIDLVNDDGKGGGHTGINVTTESQFGPGFNDMRVRVKNNKVRGGNGAGIRTFVYPDVTPMKAVSVTDNYIYDDQPVKTLLTGVLFENPHLVTSLEVRNNPCDGVIYPQVGLTTGAWMIEGGTIPRWAGYGSPQGRITASVGASYARQDGGVGQRMYFKESGYNTTRGWIPYRSAQILDWQLDTSSSLALPSNWSEWQYFLTASEGGGPPSHLHLCQQTTGSLTDSIGSLTYAVVGSPTYQVTIPGQATKGVGFTGTAAQYFGGSTGPDPTLTSVMRITLVEFPVSPGTEDTFQALTWAGGTPMHTTMGAGGGKLRSYPGGTVGNELYGGRGLVAVVNRWNRTAASHTILTNFEKFTSTYTEPGLFGGAGIGDAIGFGSVSGSKINYDVTFSGSNAEKTDNQVKSILELMGFYIPW